MGHGLPLAPGDPIGIADPVGDPLADPPLAVEAPRRRRRWWRRRPRPEPTAKPRRPRLGARGLAILMRGTAILAAVGFCVSAFVIQLTGTFRPRSAVNLREFVNRNQLGTKARTQMLLWLAAGAAAGLLAALVLYLWRRRRRRRVPVSELASGDQAADGASDDRPTAPYADRLRAAGASPPAAALWPRETDAGAPPPGPLSQPLDPLDRVGFPTVESIAAELGNPLAPGAAPDGAPSSGSTEVEVGEAPATVVIRDPAPTPRARAARVLRTARLFAPLLVPGLAWPLLLANEWDALGRASGMTFLALLAEMCVRAAAGELLTQRLPFARALQRAGRAIRRPFAWVGRFVSLQATVVVLGVLFYAVWMSYGTILQHRQFGTAAFDLGNYDTMFFNALHGRPFRCLSVLPKGGNWSMLSNHAELTMYVLLPFYAIRPGPETLLIIQATFLALGAIPLYRFAARRIPRAGAMILALAYLLYPPMHQANYYDIHFQPFAVTFTLWALDMMDARRPVLFSIFFLLALGCREDVPIGFAVLGLFLLLTGRHTRAALWMTIVSIVYFVIIKFAVMPKFGSWWFSDLYRDLYPTGENTYGGVVKTLLTNPVFVWKTLITTEKITLFFLVATPLVFLPLRRGLLWMSMLPAVPFTVLTTGYGPTVSISFQYILLYVPFMFLAAALALAAYHKNPLGRARLAGALGGVLVATILTTRVWGAMPPGDKFRGGFRDIPGFRPTTAEEKQKHRDLVELAARVPRDAPLAVSEMEHPHVSTRLNLLALRSGYEGADYLLYSEDSGGGGVEQARRALDSGDFEVVDRKADTRIALLRRKKR